MNCVNEMEWRLWEGLSAFKSRPKVLWRKMDLVGKEGNWREWCHGNQGRIKFQGVNTSKLREKSWVNCPTIGMYPEEISSIQLRCYLTTDLLTLIFIRVHACLLWCVFQGDSLKKEKKVYLFTYLWPCWVFVAAFGAFSSCRTRHCRAFSCWGAQAL